jgi:hypothetical protein
MTQRKRIQVTFDVPKSRNTAQEEKKTDHPSRRRPPEIQAQAS